MNKFIIIFFFKINLIVYVKFYNYLILFFFKLKKTRLYCIKRCAEIKMSGVKPKSEISKPSKVRIKAFPVCILEFFYYKIFKKDNKFIIF